MLRMTVIAVAIATAFPIAASAQEIEELRRDLDAARSAIRKLEERLRALEAGAPRERAATPAPAAPPLIVKETTTVVREPVVVVFTPPERFNNDQYGDPRPGGRDINPDKKGFIDLQGTETGLKIGGFVKLDGMYDTGPIGTRDWFVPATIPTTAPDNQRGPQFGLTARATRLNFEFRRNTEFGTARIFLENDFFGDDAANFRPGPYGFRLRHAYGQLGRWTAGRTFSNFIDIDSWPDTLEFYGPNAATFLFNSQVRYTHPLGDRLSLAGSVETPKTDITCNAAATCGPRERFPDLVAKLRWEEEWGHAQVSAIYRQLSYDTGVGGARSSAGTGLQVSGSVKTGLGRDYVVWSVVAGNGIQRYINDPGYFGGNDGVVSPVGSFDTLGVVAGFAGYTHYWNDIYRSTVSAGIVDNENSPFQAGNAFNRTGYYTANFIWNVFGSLNVGTELVYGSNKAKDGNTGDVVRLMFSAQYNFVR